MFPGVPDLEIAENAADVFNSISQEYPPVRAPNHNFTRQCPEMYEIANALRAAKKPKSIVRGDIDRRLVTKYSDILAIPLHAVYSKVFSTLEWPTLWSTETVHLIPKKSNPENMKQLRNLSCTPLFSKVLESFVLKSLKSKVKL